MSLLLAGTEDEQQRRCPLCLFSRHLQSLGLATRGITDRMSTPHASAVMRIPRGFAFSPQLP